jgi:hypothetical protein
MNFCNTDIWSGFSKFLDKIFKEKNVEISAVLAVLIPRG